MTHSQSATPPSHVRNHPSAVPRESDSDESRSSVKPSVSRVTCCKGYPEIPNQQEEEIARWLGQAASFTVRRDRSVGKFVSGRRSRSAAHNDPPAKTEAKFRSRSSIIERIGRRPRPSPGTRSAVTQPPIVDVDPPFLARESRTLSAPRCGP